MLPTTAAMLGFLLSPAGGCVTSAPRKITGSLKTFGLMFGTRILLIPPSFTLIFRHKFDNVCGDVLFTFFACTHCVAMPKSVSPTRFTSAVMIILFSHLCYLIFLLRKTRVCLRSEIIDYRKPVFCQATRRIPAAALRKLISSNGTWVQLGPVPWRTCRNKVVR